VSSDAITLCVASQRVFIVVAVYFVMTQSGNFWIHPRKIVKNAVVHCVLRCWVAFCVILDVDPSQLFLSAFYRICVINRKPHSGNFVRLTSLCSIFYSTL
jgi:hypothetical protein